MTLSTRDSTVAMFLVVVILVGLVFLALKIALVALVASQSEPDARMAADLDLAAARILDLERIVENQASALARLRSRAVQR